MSGRNRKEGFERLLWAESGGECPICNTQLGFPAGTDIDKLDRKYKEGKNTHRAIIAHIISNFDPDGKGMSYPKKFSDDEKKIS